MNTLSSRVSQNMQEISATSEIKMRRKEKLGFGEPGKQPTSARDAMQAFYTVRRAKHETIPSKQFR